MKWAPVPNYFDILQSRCIIMETGFLGIFAIPKCDYHEYIFRHSLGTLCTFTARYSRCFGARAHICIYI